MHSAFVPMLGLSAPAVLTLIGAGQLRSPAALSRAQVTTQVLALGPDGATWQGFAADIARFQGPAARLLLEGQRTNGVRNARCEGATVGVVGAGGALPTHWTAETSGAPTIAVVGTAVEAGVPCIDLDVTFTASGVASINFEPTSPGVAYASGTPATASFVARARAALPGTLSAQVGMAFGGGIFRQSANIALGTATLDRFGFTDSAATTSPVRPRLRLSASGAGTAQIRLGFPQIEVGAPFVSSPVLPPVGAPAAATRGADIVQATLAELGIGGGGAGTILLVAMIPQAAPAGVVQTILQLDNGSDASRFTLANAAGGGSIVANRVTAGVAGAGAAAGSMTPGTPFRIGVSLDGAGRIAASLDGAAAVAQTGGPTSGLTRLLVGSSGAAGGQEALFGEVGTLRVLPYALSDAALAAAVAALP